MFDILNNKLVFEYNIQRTVEELIERTLTLIHQTRDISAIKKLINCHEMLGISKEISIKYDGEFLDISILKELKNIGHELAVFYRNSFKYPFEVLKYSNDLSDMYSLIVLKMS